MPSLLGSWSEEGNPKFTTAPWLMVEEPAHPFADSF